MAHLFNGNNVEREDIDSLVRQFSGSSYSNDITEVFCIGLANPDLMPVFKVKGQVIVDLPQYVERWVSQYLKGYDKRPSNRTGNPSTTIPDSLVKEIYAMLHPELTPEIVSTVAKGHSVMMTIENIIGDMLEEYLSEKLRLHGWLCCWGTTIKSVDFCNLNGTLLQVKTSDNSENSSSSAVRRGTAIKKWARRKSQRQDEYYWTDLVNMTNENSLSEVDFRAFVLQIISTNPACVHIIKPTA